MLIYAIYTTYITYNLDKSFCETKTLVFFVPCYVHKKIKLKNRMPYIYIILKFKSFFFQFKMGVLFFYKNIMPLWFIGVGGRGGIFLSDKH